jgi:methionyl aminopeptidase
MKIFLKTEDEIKLMRKANQLVGLTLAELGKNIKPGVSTLQLDTIAEKFIYAHGAIPTLKSFPSPFGGPFPTSICTSVNHVIAYGIPDASTILKEGDVVSIH